MNLQPPVLSALDLVSKEEGGIDPFSLQATYEQLAERILPFITVRMARPRFLTAIAVGAVACDRLADEVAKDGSTPAWLVYEWYVIEALVRAQAAEVDLGGRVPGIQKVEAALRSRRPVSAASYLKTPRVFGFTGVYRRLATGLRIVDDDLGLDDGGYELVSAWERERGLDGYASGAHGPGARLKSQLKDAISDGLARGHTARGASWGAWKELASHLAPRGAGPKERRWLYERLLRADLEQNPRDPAATTMRQEYLERLRRHGSWIVPAEEHAYLRGLKASSDLRRRIGLIQAYEGLCAALTQAFEVILSMGGGGGASEVRGRDFCGHPLASRIARRLPGLCKVARSRFRGADADESVGALIDRYDGVSDPRRLLQVLLDHHDHAQRSKPPDGRRPWVERDGRGDRLFVRADYRMAHPPEDHHGFVHHYRAQTCCSFLRDLGRLGR